ncbi:protein SPT2 homolog [Drosophila bipectinata]|uniref:protein SPT2 homolog n=1 Tax=Drosophila bipectinata TaxID=42026 RepID=UPI001C890775|nr:protein SPT2 homolog [Drosophila bipectinata]
MDFGTLLNYAKSNNDAATTKDEGKFYKTKYAPPKKETKESKQLSTNIAKFLKKREFEEAERKREQRQKLNELMAMRDEKSKNKIRKMLKVTKSANKSVLDNTNEGDASNGHEAGEGQGDDYGYVSNEANAFYEKYIQKVRDVQEDKGFAPSRPQSLRDLSGTKERVKAAITKEREEAKSHTRQRSSTASGSSTSASTSSRSSRDPHVARSYSTKRTAYDPEAEKREEERKKKQEEEQRRAKIKRPQQPPPMDFQALLRLAEKKQHEPVMIAQPEKKKEPERLLSAREKREMEERQRQKVQRAMRDKLKELDAKATEAAAKPLPSRMEPNGRIPKLNQAKPSAQTSDTTGKSSSSDNFKRPPAPVSGQSTSSSSVANSNTNRIPATSTKPASKTSNTTPIKSSSITSKPVAGSTVAGKPATSSSSSKEASVSRNPYATVNKNGAVREFPPRDRPSGGTAPPAKTRQIPPADVRKSGGRPFPPADVKNMKRSLGPRNDQPSNKKRYLDDDDSEYDSELDDFIDDGDCEEDISSHIRDIFGYDKRRYRDIDDDDRGMESSYAQMQREEFISKKLGMQEDLEDMRMEAMHKKRKMAKKRTKRIDDDDED